MDYSNYYQFVSVNKPILHLKLSGFWTDEIINEIGDEFKRKFNSSVDSMGGKKFVVISDSSTFKPNTNKVQDMVAECMKYAMEHGLYKAIDILPDAIQRLGIQSATNKSGKSDFRIIVASLEEGKEEFSKLQSELG